MNQRKRFILLLAVLFGFAFSSNAQCSNYEIADTTTLSDWTFQIGWTYSATTIAYSVDWYGPITTTPTPDYARFRSTGPDPWVPISTTTPGHSYSIQIGDYNRHHDGRCSKAEFHVTVPPGPSYSLLYRYAVVSELSGHPSPNSPRFMMSATDITTSTTFVCPQIVVDENIPGLMITSTTMDNEEIYNPILYTNWQVGLLDLNGRAGDNIAIDFWTSNCYLTHHWACAYIEGDCILWPSSVAGCYPGITTLPTGPADFMSYDWYQLPGWTPVSGTTTVTPSTTTTYALIITPHPGQGCPDTLYTDVIPTTTTPFPILGLDHLCVGSSITLTDATTGGIWSSANTDVSVVSGSGLVTGLDAGTATITYLLGTGCMSLKTITINPLPHPIGGPTSLCLGSADTLSDPGGGTWTTGATIVTVGLGTGIITGLDAGTATITYTLPTGCSGIVTVTVVPTAVTIFGPDHLCVGSSITLSDATPGGVWSSTNTDISVTSGGGVVTGLSQGTATVTYSLGTGCTALKTITINPLPDPIGGSTSICVGSSVTLTDPGSGSWTTSATIVSVGLGTGIVTGLYTGTAVITYTLPTGCFAVITVTVNPLPDPIIGPDSVCVGSTITLSDPTTGGLWTRDPIYIPIVLVGIPTGMVTGLSAGTAIISYRLPTGCMAFKTITVNPLPAVIAGPSSVCVGSSITLTDPGGGTWSSSNTVVATIDSISGIITALSVGTTTITYTLPTGCVTTTLITVTPLPDDITGPTEVCVGSSIVVSDDSGPGVWSTAILTTPIVSIVPATGYITGLSAGTATITYTIGTGCYVTETITVNPLPKIIDGTLSVCQGLTTTLSDTSGGGVWTTAATIVTVGPGTGVVTGISPGTAVITYTLPTGCLTITTVTVNPLPDAISGPTVLCVGSSITVSDATGGGIWSTPVLTTPVISINPASGYIVGLSAGTATITYTLSTGCIVTAIITVNPLPVVPPIMGGDTLCVETATLLTDGVLGGTWSTSATIVSVLSYGMVIAGMDEGTAIISYTVSSLGCSTTVFHTIVVVAPTPPITGYGVVCSGLTDTLHNEILGGLWTSSDTTIAVVDSLTGVVTGIRTGSAIITYTAMSPCGPFTVTMTILVNAVPYISTNFTVACQSLATGGGDGVRGGPGTILPDTGCIYVCERSLVRYYGNGIGGSVTWLVTGGTIIHNYGDSIDVYWPTAGTMGSITLNESAGPCSASITICIQVISKPHALFSADEVSICLNDHVHFHDLSTADPLSPVVSWYWDFGDGSSSGAENPVHQFTVANVNDTVTLVVKNACNCTDTYRVVIHISETPGPQIQCPSVVCFGETATYSTAPGCGVYFWSVAGGTITSGWGSPTITVKWNAVGPDGFGYVSLAEPCADCPDTTTIKIPVILPHAPINGPSVICAGQQYEYTFPLWPATQYMWGVLGFPGAVVGYHDDYKVVVSFPVAGTYTIHGWYQNRLKLCGGNVDKVITVLPAVTIIGPTTVCVGSTETYTLSTPLPATWTLSTYTGSVVATYSGTSALISFPTAGNFILTTTGGFCCDPLFITVDTLPHPVNSITGATKICLGREYSYVAHATGISGYTYNWEIIGGTVTPASGSDSVSVHWTSPGTKQLSVNLVSVAAPHCAGPVVTKTVVTEVITPHVLGSTIFCPNTILPYSCDYTTGEVYDWTITPGIAGSVITGMHDPNITIQWNDYTGPATITVTVRKCDITTTASLAVTIAPPPPVTIGVVPSPACPGEDVTFTALPAGGTDYVWNFSDGTDPLHTGATNTAIHRFPLNLTSTDMIYNVTVTEVPGGTCPTSGSATFPLHVRPGPILTLSTDHVVICLPTVADLTATVSPNVTMGSYYWHYGGSTVGTGSTYTTGVGGTYTCSVTATDGCSAVSDPLEIYYSCGGGVGCTPVTVPVTTADTCNTIYLTAGDPTIDPAQSLSWFAGVTPPSGLLPLYTPTVTATYNSIGIYWFTVQGTYTGHCVDTTVADTIGIIPDFLWTKDCASGSAMNITLTDNSSLFAGWTVTSITWDDGAGPIPPGSPSTYSRPSGYYTVTETVSGTKPGGRPFSCTRSHSFFVPPGLDATFSITTSPICQNVPVLFTPLSAVGATSFYWTFGDGSSLIAFAPDRNYDFTGGGVDYIYYTTLTIHNDYGCSASYTAPVDIYKNRLSGSLGPNPQAVCSDARPLTLTYIPDFGSPAPVSNAWYSDTADLLIGTGPTYDVYQSGSYWVTVTDAYQCVATVPRPVENVEVIFTPHATITGNHDYCIGDVVKLNGYAGKSASYQWFRNGSMVGTSEMLADAGVPVGDYGYQLIIGVYDTALSVYCYDTSAIDSVHVHPLPPPPVITGPLVLDCNTYHLQLVGTEYESGAFYWSNGPSAAVDDIYTGGPYRLTFADVNGCKNYTDTYVPFSPESYFPYFPTGCYTLCYEQLPLTLYGPPDVSFNYWAWLLNGTAASSGSGLMLPYSITSAGNYQWDLDNGLCHEQSDTMEVSLIKCNNCQQINLNCSIKCTPGNPACYSVTVNFYSPAPGTSYILGTDIGPILPFSGVLTTGGLTTLSLTFTTLYPLPLPPTVTIQVEFTLPDGTKCYASETLKLPPCTWIAERHSNPGDTTQAAQNDQLTIANALMVFPNPANGNVTISYDYGSMAYQDRKISIFDEMGRKIQFNEPTEVHGSWNLNTIDWAPGVYIIRMEGSGQALQTQKLVIGH